MTETTTDLEAWIDALAPVLKLEIAAEFRPGVRANLETAAKMAAILDAVVLDDEAEPAPVFSA